MAFKKYRKLLFEDVGAFICAWILDYMAKSSHEKHGLRLWDKSSV